VHVLCEVHRRIDDLGHSLAAGVALGVGGLRRAEVRPGTLEIDLADRLLLVGVLDEHPLPALRVGTGGRLQRQFEAFHQHFVGYRLVEIEALAH